MKIKILPTSVVNQVIVVPCIGIRCTSGALKLLCAIAVLAFFCSPVSAVDCDLDRTVSHQNLNVVMQSDGSFAPAPDPTINAGALQFNCESSPDSDPLVLRAPDNEEEDYVFEYTGADPSRAVFIGAIPPIEILNIVTFTTEELLEANVDNFEIENHLNIKSSADNTRGIRAGNIYNGNIIFRNFGKVHVTGNRVADSLGNSGNADGIYFHSDKTYNDSISRKADATFVNEAGAEILVEGDGGKGLIARTFYHSESTTKVINRGHVETRGEIFTYCYAVDDCDYFGPWGILAEADEGSSEIENYGTVKTKGQDGFGLYAYANASGSSEIENYGTVETMGQYGYGLYALTRGSSEIVNYGTVKTKGQDGHGLYARTRPSGQSAKNSAKSVNYGTVTTEGDSARGVRARVEGENTIAEIHNFGSVTVGRASALLARAVGENSIVRILMNGGTVVVGDIPVNEAQALNDPSFRRAGIYAIVHDVDESTLDENKIPIEVEVSNSTINEGIEYETPPAAAWFTGGRAKFTVTDSMLTGRVLFSGVGPYFDGVPNNDDAPDGDDEMFIVGNTRIKGDIDFFGGDDTLDLNTRARSLIDIDGEVRGLETYSQDGKGTVRMRRDVTFTSSEAVIESGTLIIRGNFDLGSDGEMTVKDSSRLVFEYKDTLAEDHGRVTAKRVVFEGSPEIFIQTAADADHDDANTDFKNSIDDTNPNSDPQFLQVQEVDSDSNTNNGMVDITIRTAMDRDYVTIGTLKLNEAELLGTHILNQITLLSPDSELGRSNDFIPQSATNGNGGNSGILALAVLFMVMYSSNCFDDSLAAALQFLDCDDEDHPQSFDSSGGDSRRLMRGDAVEYRIRQFSAEAPGLAKGEGAVLKGLAIDASSLVADGFRIGFSAAPEVFASTSTLSLSNDGMANLKGSHYTAWASWNQDNRFVNVAASLGNYDARSVFENPVSGDAMTGDLNLTRSQFEIGGGIRFASGGLSVVPSLSAFSGSIKQSAHEASGAVFNAEMPGLAWNYRGWKVGLNVSPTEMISTRAGLSLKPELQLNSWHIHSDNPSSFDLRQSDRLGVLDFQSRVLARRMPRTVHSLNAGINMKQSDRLRMRIGYTGLLVDDDPVHAVTAQLQMRF